MIRNTTASHGFSLVELSVVLVVIGLIVGSVIGGQSILRASQIRSIGTDLTAYAGAFQQFRMQYHTLPGDLINASSFWGAADGGTGATTACYAVNETNGTATCNGNGDGTLSRSNPVSGLDNGYEDYLAWKHMSNAGLITGTYSGRTADPANIGRASVGGINGPRGKIQSSVYALRNVGCKGSGDVDDDGDNFYAGCYGTILFFGLNNYNTLHPLDLITPDEMYNLDQKMDDGYPGDGQFRDVMNDPACSSDAQTYVIGVSDNKSCHGLIGIDPIE